MDIKSFFKIACPIDLSPLQQKENSYECLHRHKFDVAKSGYVNLLPAHLKNSKHPGDSVQMVKARTRFLETGLYDLILHHIYEKIMFFISNHEAEHFNIIDAGCGDGYYTDGIKKMLANATNKKTCAFIGYDISKEAILPASKRSKEIKWAVATNKRIPICNHSSNIVISIFGFPIFEEFNRVLEKGGMLLLVEPGPEHLLELRKALYPMITEKKMEEKNEKINNYFLLNEKTRYQEPDKKFSSENINDLLCMTPHGFRASKEKIKFVMDNPPLTMMIDVLISSYLVK
jgi:23S rRNA (guanine745-N1)-methyltransferase